MSSSRKALFVTDPDLAYFDHGGYCLPLREVVRFQQDLNDRINRNPSRFFRFELMEELARIRLSLAVFLQCSAENLCFFNNATHAMAMILKNQNLGPQDAVLIPSLIYHGTRIALQLLARESGFQLIEAPIRLPVASAEDIVDAIARAYTPKVKLAIIDHISSPTSVLFPVKTICQFLKEKGVTVVIDGAQSPGQVPINLRELRCDFFIGNGHKWLTGPRTSAFLAVSDPWKESLQGLIRARADDFPAAGRSRIQMETDWPGAYDPIPILALPTALEQLKRLYSGSMDQLYEENHKNLCRGLQIMAERIAHTPLAHSSLFASMVSIRLDDRYASNAGELQNRIFADGVAAQVYPGSEPGSIYLRVCHQAYLESDDYYKLGDALARSIIKRS